MVVVMLFFLPSQETDIPRLLLARKDWSVVEFDFLSNTQLPMRQQQSSSTLILAVELRLYTNGDLLTGLAHPTPTATPFTTDGTTM
mmetsp:Transcript_18926/g.24350  ORF Transcript_18926/g.24350 Transcript_18926/m.24350 type:complete len:86 (-) Transcript_18926:1381-1638(-)